jgi:hypothetical protein
MTQPPNHLHEPPDGRGFDSEFGNRTRIGKQTRLKGHSGNRSARRTARPSGDNSLSTPPLFAAVSRTYQLAGMPVTCLFNRVWHRLPADHQLTSKKRIGSDNYLICATKHRRRNVKGGSFGRITNPTTHQIRYRYYAVRYAGRQRLNSVAACFCRFIGYAVLSGEFFGC